VRIERLIDGGAPHDPNVPWVIQAMPWNTVDENHPRYGKVVGFLFYRGTKSSDPMVYAGAFDVRWADAGAAWTVLAQ
jgi:hypothetical protein